MNGTTAVKTLSKIFRDEGWRVFMLAILASLVWHLFWLSTITVVSDPANARSVKFSKVSFLGPLLGNGGMGLQARPRERSFLETRYLDRARSPEQGPESAITAAGVYDTGDDSYRMRDEKMTALIDEALDGEKLEPSREE